MQEAHPQISIEMLTICDTNELPFFIDNTVEE